MIVTASGPGAAAVALWCDARQHAADALILHSPEFAARPGLTLDIDCPVLVLAEQRQQRRRRPAAAGIHLGGHVTWLRLRAPAARLTARLRAQAETRISTNSAAGSAPTCTDRSAISCCEAERAAA